MALICNYLKTEDQVIKACAKALDQVFEAYQRNLILFLVSGGSSLKILDELDIKNLDNRFTISVLDERFSQKQSENNFLQLQKLKFYQKAIKNGCKFIETVPDLKQTQEDLAKRFEKALKEWRDKNPDGVVVITQGIGEDGHTGGIMPFPEDEEKFNQLFNSKKLVVGYDAKGKNPYPLRVTTTLTFLREWVDTSLVFITGNKKKKVLKDLMLKEKEVYKMPSQVVWQMKEVMVFTDIKLNK